MLEVFEILLPVINFENVHMMKNTNVNQTQLNIDIFLSRPAGQ